MNNVLRYFVGNCFLVFICIGCQRIIDIHSQIDDQIGSPLGQLYGSTVTGGNGSGAGNDQLSYPPGIFLDEQGSIYIANASNHRVHMWPKGASIGITVAGGNEQGNAANQLSYRAALFVDKKGSIYIVDRGNSRVQRWDPGASAGKTVAGGNE